MSKLEKFDLDTLLQWKRNEKPSEAFWETFDAQLQQRLAAEKIPQVFSFRVFFQHLVLRWIPVTAACAVALSFYLDSTMKTSQRFIALHLPTSIEQCSTNFQSLANTQTFIPMKNVIEKKNVASIAPRCFSF